MSDLDTCRNEIQQEINLYWSFVYISLTLTVVNVIFRNILRNGSNPEENYGKAVKLFVVTGIIKCIFGILLITVLLPTCPAGCTCGHIGHPTYGYVALALGFLWLYYAHVYYKKLQEAGVQYGEVAMSKPEISMTSPVV
ncbi:expressed unknown protein [Seminavis robusta]|uniref:Uncharacterized protein n=1 Tax=Seminavis robusta TaxID=568900 RepID=A0A9N8EVX5_9STRA|nr:expressed unknown protein [Seminavis robusta]|eukprot:Sro1845_g301320.1 n/a (139) ;mRNA; r:20917-21333